MLCSFLLKSSRHATKSYVNKVTYLVCLSCCQLQTRHYRFQQQRRRQVTTDLNSGSDPRTHRSPANQTESKSLRFTYKRNDLYYIKELEKQKNLRLTVKETVELANQYYRRIGDRKLKKKQNNRWIRIQQLSKLTTQPTNVANLELGIHDTLPSLYC